MALIFNGKSSDDFNVRVEKYPARKMAVRRQTMSSIPGRNGSLLFSENCFDNTTQEYEIYLSAEREKLPMVSQAVAEWLYGPGGYARLEDTYDPEVFRQAAFSGPFNLSNVFNRFGKATISFDCKPQKFYKNGENAIKCSKNQVLLNPTGFEASPIIEVDGSGACTLTVGGTTVNILSLSHLILDCDFQNAYYGSVNLNSTISCDEFPKLRRGNNIITWTGNISSVKVTPRWWTL